MTHLTPLGHSIYSKTTKAGETIYYCRVYDNGRSYLCRGGRTERQARTLRDRLNREIDTCRVTGISWQPPREKRRQERAARKQKIPTVEEFAARFLEDWVGEKPSRTFYQKRIKAISKKLGSRPITQLELGGLQRWYTQRIAESSITTANHDLTTLRTMLTRAVEWGLLTENVATRVKKERPPVKKDRFLYAEEYQALLEKCAPWLAGVIRVAVNTGLRKAELLSLTWSDHVDLERRVIRVRGKGSKLRTVPINEDLCEILREIRRSPQTDRVFWKRTDIRTRDGVKTRIVPVLIGHA